MKIRVSDVPILLVLISYGILFSLILLGIITFDYFPMFIITYTYVIVFCGIIAFNKAVPKMTAGMMVLYYSFIQAVGIPLAYLFDMEYTLQQIERSKYFNGMYIDKYISLSLLAVTSALIGIIMFCGKRQQSKSIEHGAANVQSKLEKNFVRWGFFFIIAFAMYMILNLAIGRIALNNYLAYKQWANNDPIRNYLQMGYWYAGIFICACGTKKQIVSASILYIIPSAILMMAGNRNDVFYPLLIGLGIYCMRYKKIPKAIVAMLVVLVFFISPLFIQLRNGFDVSVTDIFDGMRENLAKSIFELGGQLHAVSNMFSWLDNGENLAYGMTYLLGALCSLIGDFFPDIVTYFEASRYAIQPRVATLGFSMSAEIYFNFHLIGVMIVYFLIGRYISKNEKMPLSVVGRVFYGFCMFWLLFLVRNEFRYSIAYAKVFCIIVFVVCIFTFGRNVFVHKTTEKARY